MGAEDAGRMALKTKTKSKTQRAANSPNAFAGQLEQPTQKAVETALGRSYALWTELVTELKQEFQLDAEDWHSSGVKYGWALRLQKQGRNIVYLGPRSGSFVAAFVLGDKAVAIVRKSNLPANLIKTIAETKRYGEGTPVRVEVSKPGDLQPIKILARIKVEN